MNDNKARAEVALATILREASGLEIAQLDRTAKFIELGFDSLFLIQLSQRLKRKFGVKIAFRQLMEDVATVDSLIEYLSKHTTAMEPQPVRVDHDRAAQPAAPSPTSTTSGPSIRMVANQHSDAATESTFAVAPGSNSSNTTVTTPAKAIPNQPRTSSNPQLSSSAAPTMRHSVSQTESQGSSLEQIILLQNQLMLRHLELLNGTAAGLPTCSTVGAGSLGCSASECSPLDGSLRPAIQTSTAAAFACDNAEPVIHEDNRPSTVPDTPANLKKKTFERFGPYKPVRKGSIQGLTDSQHQHLQAFIQRFTQRTAKSRTHAQNYRSQFADPRGVAGYRRIWKSMVYQVVVERSKGSKLWDIDGNEYIDIAMGFGLNLFGQSPDFVTSALHRQLDRGVEVGPQTALAGEVATLLCQFSRKDRATFCNTGSEAVMAALRLARTVNGKTKTVFFNRDYHGNFDQVLLRSQTAAASAGSAPAAPGVPDWYAENTIVLPYGSEESLEVIEAHADDIAAVLVEPCQSADPFIQPREFLHRLREITRRRQIALVMDEVITGFRAAPGGAQEWYDVWGDMATYGKILGGGMPIGALAGTKEYMDALDGGDWRYEDDSEPDTDMTFFAGTFVRHPLAIAAAYEVLKRVKEEGPALQQRLTDRTVRLASTLNQFFEDEQFPIRIAQFASLFRFMFPADLEFADMLYFHLLDRGIFTRGWGDNCFLSTEHTDHDVQRIIEAVKSSCLEIRAAGFFPDKSETIDLKKKSVAAEAISTAEPESTPVVPITTDLATCNTSTVLDDGSEDQMSTINTIQEGTDRPPLFCMPAADGLTLVYHELAEELGADQPVYGLDSPAIYREPIPDTLEELAARFVKDLREIQPHGPYYLIGYCSGGTTALEVAQQLMDAGERVSLLGLLETYNWRDLPSTNPTLWVKSHYQFERIKFHLYNFWLLDWSAKKDFCRSKYRSLLSRTKVWKGAVRRLFNRSEQGSRDGLVDMNEIWLKHDQIAEAYNPRRFQGKLTHFRPIRDYKCNLGEEYDAQEVDYRTLQVYPAGMMSRPFVQQLATQLRELITASLDQSLAQGGKAKQPQVLQQS